jgi:alkanesulfonate monooxygenase SsuD/methylene tetrahydromethanopterin reductase-like flavin-dependent oxidoreductase (luciferase family)
VRFGLDLAQQRLSWKELVSRARLADELGFDGIWGFDHFEPMYGEGPGPCFEGMTTLAALAGLTATVRLGLLVTGMTYRHPSVLAAQAVTVDHASQGRLELALGAAWFREEHDRLGIPFPPTRERIDRFAEAVQVIRLLMTTDEATFTGRHYRLDHATYLPRPVQRPHPPMWIGAHGERMVGLAAKYADVWHDYGTPESLAARSVTFDRLAEQSGRDPTGVMRASNLSLSQPLDGIKAVVDQWRRAGCGYLICGWPTEGQGRVEEFAARVLPAFS